MPQVGQPGRELDQGDSLARADGPEEPPQRRKS